MDIDQMTVGEIEEELEKRKEQERLNSIPKLLDNPDIESLKKFGQEYINTIAESGYEPKYAVGDRFVIKNIKNVASDIYTVEAIIETEGEYYYKLDHAPYLKPESVLEEKFLRVLT